MPSMSERDFAVLVGATHSQVQRRRKAGKLPKSAAQNDQGHWRIDSEVGVKEWAAGSGLRVSRKAGDPDEGDDLDANRGWQEARTRREAANAARAELELARLRGEVVDAKDLEARLAGLFTECRNKLLGVPHRLKQRCPHLANGDVSRVDELIREALEALADRTEIGGAP